MSQPTFCDVQKETQKRENPFKGGGKDVCVCVCVVQMLLRKSAGCSSETPRQQISFSLLLLRPREEKEEGRGMGMLFAINQGQRKEKRDCCSILLFTGGRELRYAGKI